MSEIQKEIQKIQKVKKWKYKQEMGNRYKETKTEQKRTQHKHREKYIKTKRQRTQQEQYSK